MQLDNSYRLLEGLASQFPSINLKKIAEQINLIEEKLETSSFWSVFIQKLNSLVNQEAQLSIMADGSLALSSHDSLSFDQKQLLDKVIEFLIPWRNGPILFFERLIESEWNSDLRWQRLKELFEEIQGKVVADVGCGNGYFAFRMLSASPEFLIGLDPAPRAYFQCQLLQKYAKEKKLAFLPLGVDDLTSFSGVFDLVVCLGVIYHRRNPLHSINCLFQAIRKGGRLIIESMTLPMEGSYALFPAERYAKMGNVWFLPTRECLYNWLKRVGFLRVENVMNYTVETTEQRASKDSPYESLENFLMPDDASKTIEGHPAPERSVMLCTK